MAPSNGPDSALSRKFGEICSDLNLDKAAADEAFNSFQRIQINYTLDVSVAQFSIFFPLTLQSDVHENIKEFSFSLPIS